MCIRDSILLRSSSWPLFGFSYGGTDYYWCVLPFGFNLSPWCYHTLSEAKMAYLRSIGLACLDGSWFSNFRASHGPATLEQGLGGGRGHTRGDAGVVREQSIPVCQDV